MKQRQSEPATGARTQSEMMFWPLAYWSPLAWLGQPETVDRAQPETREPPAGTNGLAAGLDALVQSFNPFLMALTATNSEMIKLAVSRTKAMSETSFMASNCWKPHEMARLQAQYWDLATKQYGSTVQQVLAAWHPIMPFIANSGASNGLDHKHPNAKKARDVMSFPAAAASATGGHPLPSAALPLAAKRPLNERRSVA